MNVTEEVYLRWRDQGSAALCLREARPTGAPPERWLQELWAHQRLRRDQLHTSQGRKLVVLHPGFWNREAGPDFLGAVIRIDDLEPVAGDVEIDVHSGGWRSHGHAGNAAYANVILHVVWSPPDSLPPLPTLALHDALDAPVEELEAWVGGAGDVPSEWLTGQCSAPLRQLPPGTVDAILSQAALARLRTKGLLFRARAKAAGWHQALAEGVFRALGYKHNPWPMQRLAESLPLLHAHPVDPSHPREAWEARLLGLSGLLPAEPKSGTRARRLWDRWWRERETFQSALLPANLWRLNGVRPANHPQRRLALAAAWLADEGWQRRLESWFVDQAAGPDRESDLLAALRPECDPFWRRHYTLSAKTLPEPCPLLGHGRLNDLAVNAILPWFWARAESVDDRTTRQRVEALFLDWPAGDDNSTLKLARSRLFGPDTPPIRRRASTQQGLLQIVRDFCSYSNALCDRCRFPSLVRELHSVPESHPSPPTS